ncbi:MAG: response regulator transcription factor [Actinomycetales bacterium]|nr:response regulator transcription factor [Actinomycetales bacterium]
MSLPEARGRRLVLVDDHEVISIALESAVAAVPGLEYLGRAESIDELLATFPEVDLAVLDLRLPDGSSPVTNVERLSEAGIDTIIYTSGEHEHLVRAAARTSALGLVRKSAPLSVLIESLERIAEGLPLLSTELAAAIDTDPELERAALSAQERRVLSLFARGWKAQAVADELGISVNTVNDYVRRIRAKYGEVGRPAYTKVDLYMRAVEDGILPGPDSHHP